MPSITVRNIDNSLKDKLRIRAARNGRSMEDEARALLRAALAEEEQPNENLASAIRRRIAPLGGVELPLVQREPNREPPDFSEPA